MASFDKPTGSQNPILIKKDNTSQKFRLELKTERELKDIIKTYTIYSDVQ